VLPGIGGYDVIRYLASRSPGCVPIMAHPSMLGALVLDESEGIAPVSSSEACRGWQVPTCRSSPFRRQVQLLERGLLEHRRALPCWSWLPVGDDSCAGRAA